MSDSNELKITSWFVFAVALCRCTSLLVCQLNSFSQNCNLIQIFSDQMLSDYYVLFWVWLNIHILGIFVKITQCNLKKLVTLAILTFDRDSNNIKWKSCSWQNSKCGTSVGQKGPMKTSWLTNSITFMNCRSKCLTLCNSFTLSSHIVRVKDILNKTETSSFVSKVF